MRIFVYEEKCKVFCLSIGQVITWTKYKIIKETYSYISHFYISGYNWFRNIDKKGEFNVTHLLRRNIFRS